MENAQEGELSTLSLSFKDLTTAPLNDSGTVYWEDSKRLHIQTITNLKRRADVQISRRLGLSNLLNKNKGSKKVLVTDNLPQILNLLILHGNVVALSPSVFMELYESQEKTFKWNGESLISLKYNGSTFYSAGKIQDDVATAIGLLNGIIVHAPPYDYQISTGPEENTDGIAKCVLITGSAILNELAIANSTTTTYTTNETTKQIATDSLTTVSAGNFCLTPTVASRVTLKNVLVQCTNSEEDKEVRMMVVAQGGRLINKVHENVEYMVITDAVCHFAGTEQIEATAITKFCLFQSYEDDQGHEQCLYFHTPIQPNENAIGKWRDTSFFIAVKNRVEVNFLQELLRMIGLRCVEQDRESSQTVVILADNEGGEQNNHRIIINAAKFVSMLTEKSTNGESKQTHQQLSMENLNISTKISTPVSCSTLEYQNLITERYFNLQVFLESELFPYFRLDDDEEEKEKVPNDITTAQYLECKTLCENQGIFLESCISSPTPPFPYKEGDNCVNLASISNNGILFQGAYQCDTLTSAEEWTNNFLTRLGELANQHLRILTVIRKAEQGTGSFLAAFDRNGKVWPCIATCKIAPCPRYRVIFTINNSIILCSLAAGIPSLLAYPQVYLKCNNEASCRCKEFLALRLEFTKERLTLHDGHRFRFNELHQNEYIASIKPPVILNPVSEHVIQMNGLNCSFNTRDRQGFFKMIKDGLEKYDNSLISAVPTGGVMICASCAKAGNLKNTAKIGYVVSCVGDKYNCKFCTNMRESQCYYFLFD